MKRFLLPIAAAVIGTAAHAQAVEAGQEDSLRMYRLQEIEVTATRADAATPVAYTDIARDEIARNSFGFDIPSVLALTPSMVATNETGIGIGATSVRLRGTDATRLNVTINGVAMNNPDSHSMYWYDTPDLISSVGTVQVQRGAGLSTNGTGAFGGAVNMSTAPLETEFGGDVSLSYGSYNTNKQAVHISSGLMGGHWTLDARLTHIGSEGYIDRGATDLKSYMFQAGYYNGSTMLKLISFGGKAKTGLTYTGATKEEMRLNGRRFHTEGMYYTSNGPHSYYYMKDGERQRISQAVSQATAEKDKTIRLLQSTLKASRHILSLFADMLYKASEVFRCAIDAIIHFGTEQHKSFFAPSEAADIKSVMQEYGKTTEQQNAVGAWLCDYAEHRQPFDEIKHRHTLNEVGDVAEGRYDWKIERGRGGVTL